LTSYKVLLHHSFWATSCY